MKISNLRWWICGLLFSATVISYVDRQAMSVVAPVIASEFHLNNEETGRILAAFLLAYAFGQLAAGRFFDWTGTRVGFGISVALWSLANMLTATVTRAWAFSFFRFMLGVGESGNFPGGVKVLREWFPARERTFAGGVFTSGASVGAIIAAPLVAGLTHAFGWRVAFLLTGSLGFLWLVFWLAWYHLPAEHPLLTAGEHSLILDEAHPENGQTMRWAHLFRFRQVWALVLARVLEEPVIWMLLFWLPKYMVDIRGLSLLQAGWVVTVPFIALDCGYVGGGWLSSRLMRHGWTGRRSKLACMNAGAVLMAGCIPAAFSSGVAGFVAGVSCATLGHGIWFSNLLAIPTEISPANLVASVYGISALGGGIGGIAFTELTGVVADRFHSFTPILLVAGLLPTLATLGIVVVGGPMRRLSVAPSPQARTA